ncbi:MAG TPA: hypothetical protein VFM80_05320 [Gracilimonas sp.]|uniref:hypothetical protein n=1 Tax=Gracilimonas sp. TaxID=1974203 RepID=UPI002DA6E260|nr:hypothetical protein [Gracilimonas sp.]
MSEENKPEKKSEANEASKAGLAVIFIIGALILFVSIYNSDVVFTAVDIGFIIGFFVMIGMYGWMMKVLMQIRDKIS